MFLERNVDKDINIDKPIAGGNFGTVDFGRKLGEQPDWLELSEEEFLTPGAVKEAEEEEATIFLTDTPRDAYTDDATKSVIEFDAQMNPTHVVGRQYLLADRSGLIRDGATLLQEVMRSLQPIIFSRQPNLSRMVTADVTPSGHVQDGELIWSVEISAANQPGVHRTQQSTPTRKMRVAVPMKIKEGLLQQPRIFTTASNKIYPLTVEGCQVALKWKEEPIGRKRPGQVELAQQPERDYRAF
jgi:hypothetical protein